MPSWPAFWKPQHSVVMSLIEAQAKNSPKVMSVAYLEVPRSTNGREEPVSPDWSPACVVSPLPRIPWLPMPQHFTWPDAMRAQVLYRPVTTLCATMPGPRSTSWGVDCEAVVPRPSLP